MSGKTVQVHAQITLMDQSSAVVEVGFDPPQGDMGAAMTTASLLAAVLAQAEDPRVHLAALEVLADSLGPRT